MAYQLYMENITMSSITPTYHFYILFNEMCFKVAIFHKLQKYQY